jgi:hypothetical protein
MEYLIDGYAIQVFECRPRWDDPAVWLQIPIAKIRFTRKTSEWQLYWHRANGKWMNYEPLLPSRDLVRLVNEIDTNPYGTFFG